ISVTLQRPAIPASEPTRHWVVLAPPPPADWKEAKPLLEAWTPPRLWRKGPVRLQAPRQFRWSALLLAGQSHAEQALVPVPVPVPVPERVGAAAPRPAGRADWSTPVTRPARR